MKALLQALLVTLFLSTTVFADEESIGPNGINSAGLLLPNGMPLNGAGSAMSLVLPTTLRE